jgi:hypothetical protein
MDSIAYFNIGSINLPSPIYSDNPHDLLVRMNFIDDSQITDSIAIFVSQRTSEFPPVSSALGLDPDLLDGIPQTRFCLLVLLCKELLRLSVENDSIGHKSLALSNLIPLRILFPLAPFPSFISTTNLLGKRLIAQYLLRLFPSGFVAEIRDVIREGDQLLLRQFLQPINNSP